MKSATLFTKSIMLFMKSTATQCFSLWAFGLSPSIGLSYKRPTKHLDWATALCTILLFEFVNKSALGPLYVFSVFWGFPQFFSSRQMLLIFLIYLSADESSYLWIVRSCLQIWPTYQMSDMSSGWLVLFQWLNLYDSNTVLDKLRKFSQPNYKEFRKT